MAKSRAQRKAEQRKKRQQQLEDRARQSQSKAQHDTQVPESGDVAEVEAAMEAGAEAADRPDPTAPAPSRADVGSPEEAAVAAEAAGEKRSRREERKAQKEKERAARESAERRAPKEQKVERERGRVASFFASVISELRKVQWPDRDTLVQASAVTLLFVAIAAAYLGVMDAIFGWLVDQLIT
jgi:preprotein translocase SecE subunit